MSDKIDMTPELTLDPTGAAQAAQAETALRTPEAPTLTLEPTLGAEETAAAQAQRDANAVKIDESMLTEAERKMVDDFSQKIDITDSNVVLQYGAAAQKNVASFSENTLNSPWWSSSRASTWRRRRASWASSSASATSWRR